MAAEIRRELTTIADPVEPPAAQAEVTPPATDTERALAEVLAEVMGAEQVSIDSHVFEDLGADSMVMAHFCARVRKRADLPPVSMKDIYRNPTLRGLAAALAPAAAAPAAATPVASAAVEAPIPAPVPAVRPVGTLRYLLCGLLQFVFFLASGCLGGVVLSAGYDWISGGAGIVEIYLRAVAFGGASLIGLSVVPILAKWTLIGRWKPREIRIWSVTYVRFWIVKTIVRSNPMVLVFVGSPLYTLYLRALGAKVGRGATILSRNVPVCTDLITIGDRTVIRKDTYLTGYRAHAGMIQTGPVTLGSDVFVGQHSVLDIDTSLGDGAQLGHSSSLHAGQAVPDGEHWHGSPAQPTEVDYRTVEPMAGSTLRRATYTIRQLLILLGFSLPLVMGAVAVLLDDVPRLTSLLDSGNATFTSWQFYRGALAVAFVLYVGALLVGLLLVLTVPRLLNLAIRPDKVYPLYGLQYSVNQTIARLTNLPSFHYLFGDSSYIVHYLRALGYDLSDVEQTGSNFGTGVAHDTPYLSSVGRGTMVADGLSIINTDYSGTSFRVSRVSIGAHNFLGNQIAYPPQGRTGDNCLLATKVLVPIDGRVREGVGLLGSPSFEIPRTVDRDSRVHKSGEELRRSLRAKNRYNLRSIGVALLTRWLYVLGLTLLVIATANSYQQFGAEAVAAEILVFPLFTTGYFVLLERGFLRFRRLRPEYCSIYDPYFWWHERYWKLVMPRFDMFFSGTPFKNTVSRLLGARVGRRVYDDGCFMTERTLTTIGGDCTLNVGSVIQNHSQEDGSFKSDHIRLGAGCTVGIGALIHYGVTIGDGAVLAADSFLMKGSEVAANAHWGGNPAGEVRADRDQVEGRVALEVAEPVVIGHGFWHRHRRTPMASPRVRDRDRGAA